MRGGVLLYNLGFPGEASGKEPACQCRRLETWLQSLGQEESLERKMATCSSILAWEIPCTEKTGRLQSLGLQRVRHDLLLSIKTISPHSLSWLAWVYTYLHSLPRPVAGKALFCIGQNQKEETGSIKREAKRDWCHSFRVSLLSDLILIKVLSAWAVTEL